MAAIALVMTLLPALPTPVSAQEVCDPFNQAVSECIPDPSTLPIPVRTFPAQTRNWTPQESLTGQTLNDVSCNGTLHCHAVGKNGTIIATTDGGATWVAQDSGTNTELFGISCSDYLHCHAAGRDDTVLSTTDGGATWTRQRVPTTPSTARRFNAVSCPDALTCYVAGNYGTPTADHGRTRLLVTRDGGASWTVAQPDGENGDHRAASSPSACHAVVVGDSAGGPANVVSTVDGGTVWRHQQPATYLSALLGVSFVDPLTGYAVGSSSGLESGGTIIATTDGGTTWVSQTMNIEVGNPKGFTIGDFLKGKGKRWNDVSFIDKNDGVVVGTQGILATHDGGQNWFLQLDGAGSPYGALNAVSMAGPTTAYAVGNDGRILKATNLLADPEAPQHAPSICPTPPGSSLPAGSESSPVTQKVIWVNSTGDEGDAGIASARDACSATSGDSGQGTCTLRRAIEVANETDGAEIKFDHQVFKSSPQPTQIVIDPATRSYSDRGHFLITADNITIDGEPDCELPSGAVGECTPEQLQTPALDALRPRVWIRSIANDTPDVSTGANIGFGVYVGFHGILQVGRVASPTRGNAIRGLLISGSRAFSGGAIEVASQETRIEQNVLAFNGQAITMQGSLQDDAGTPSLGHNVVADNYFGPVEALGLASNDLAVVLRGSADVVGGAGHGNLIRGGSRNGSDGILVPGRSNVVAGNIIAGPGSDGIIDVGRGTMIGGPGDDEGNSITGWDTGFVGKYPVVEMSGGYSAVVGNRISNNDIGVDAASQTRIGGLAAGEPNAITDNSSVGIKIGGDSRIKLLGNQVSGNGEEAVSGPAANVLDLDAMPTTVTGTAPPGSLIEAFLGAPYADGSGQGERFLGRAMAAGNGRFLIAVSGLQPGDHVAVTVGGTDGSTSAFSNAVPVADGAQPDPSSPSSPQGLSAIGVGGGVSLRWDPVAGASGYEIYRGTTSNFDPAPELYRTSATGTSYTDEGLPSGVTYHYKVVAYSEAGARSAVSAGAAAAASSTSSDLLQLVVNQPGDASTCASGGQTCLSLPSAVRKASDAPLAGSGMRAVVTFDPSVFPAGGSGRINGCCFDLSAGGIALLGDGRVQLHNPGSGGARGISLGDDNVVQGIGIDNYGVAITATGLRSTVVSNVLSGNDVGVDVLGGFNSVGGNRIINQDFHEGGVFGSGYGVLVGGAENSIGGGGPAEGNVISGNARGGIFFQSAGNDNEVLGNQIGIDPLGDPAANRGPGVRSDAGAWGNRVYANTIAFNYGPGVLVGELAPRALDVSRNSIYSNDARGIAIAGTETSCEGDIPPAPVLTAADPNGSISGSACPHARVEVFAAAPDSAGAVQGKTFIADTIASASGDFSFSELNLSSERGPFTATATVDGSTSEFSAGAKLPDIHSPGAVLHLDAAAVDATTVELSWGAPGQDGDGRGAPAQLYEIRQSRSKITGADFDSDNVRHLCDGKCFDGTLTKIDDPVTFTVTDLAPNVEYHWAVRAIDDFGNRGPISGTGLRTSDVAPGAITDLAAKALSGSEIQLTFSATGSDGRHPPAAQRYVIKQSKVPIVDERTFDVARSLCNGACRLTPDAVGDRVLFSVTDLLPRTTYYYAVVAQDESGNTAPLSNVADATTTSATPGAVSDLRARAVSKHRIRLIFSTPGSDGLRPPPVKTFVIKQSRSPIRGAQKFDEARSLCRGGCTFSPRRVGDRIRFRVTHLKPGKKYHYAVRARNDAGDLSHISNRAKATTLGNGSGRGRVNHLVARAVSGTAIKLTFPAEALDGRHRAPATGYVIKQSLRPIRSQQDFKSALSLCRGPCALSPARVGQKLTFTVVDLRPRTTYYYALTAVGASGKGGPRSRTAKATTLRRATGR